MKRTLLLIAMLVSLKGFGQDTTTVGFDFNNLVIGNLNGQDGWVTTKYNTAVDVAVSTAASNDGSNGISFGTSGPSVGVDGSRSLDTIFGSTMFTDYSAKYVITFDVFKSYWGLDFGIGADLDNDGKIVKTNTAEQVFKFSASQVSGERVILPDGSNNTFPGITNVYNQVQITIDNLSNGMGSILIEARSIGTLTWAPLFGTQLGIDTNSAGKKNPSNWDMVYFHFEGALNKMDNITITKILPGPVGITENASTNMIKLYPNPCSSNVNLELDENITGNATIEIRSMSGSLLYSKGINQFEKKNVDVSMLSSGVYFLELKTERGNYFQKLVKE